jgi:hypothetical protein
LLGEAVKCNRYSSVKRINSEITCEAMTTFLESNIILLSGKQFEMVKKLYAIVYMQSILKLILHITDSGKIDLYFE